MAGRGRRSIERKAMKAELPAEFDPRTAFRSFPRVVLAVLLSPRDFFQALNRRGGYAAPFLFLTICVLIHVAMVGLYHRNYWLVLQNLAMGVSFPFITAGVLHFILVKWFRSAGTYEAAFRVNAYSAAVNMVTWIPVAGLVMEFYRIYLLMLGLSAVYAVRASRALIALVLTMAGYILVSGILSSLTGMRPGAP
jgi:hypothetical protein